MEGQGWQWFYKCEWDRQYENFYTGIKIQHSHIMHFDDLKYIFIETKKN